MLFRCESSREVALPLTIIFENCILRGKSPRDREVANRVPKKRGESGPGNRSPTFRGRCSRAWRNSRGYLELPDAVSEGDARVSPTPTERHDRDGERTKKGWKKDEVDRVDIVRRDSAETSDSVDSGGDVSPMREAAFRPCGRSRFYDAGGGRPPTANRERRVNK